MQKKYLKVTPLSSTLFLGLLLNLLIGCQSKSEFEPPLPRLGETYMPLSIGKFIEYEADSVIYDPQPNNAIKIDTIRFWVRDVITDSLRDASGQMTYTIEHFQRKDTAQAWQIKRVWSAAHREDYVERSEENLRYLKIPQIFQEKMAWNAHVFISSDLEIKVADEAMQPFSKKWTFNIESFGKAENVNNKNYSDVLTIKGQTDPRIFNERRYTLEKYAKGIGLIFKETYILDTQNANTALTWERRAERGFIFRLKAIRSN